MKVTPEMIKAGQDMASLLIDATCEKGMGGLGGCKNFDINNYPKKYRKLILKYINEEIVSVTAIYTAMEMEK